MSTVVENESANVATRKPIESGEAQSSETYTLHNEPGGVPEKLGEAVDAEPKSHRSVESKEKAEKRKRHHDEWLQALYQRVRNQIEDGHYRRALRDLNHHFSSDPVLMNARGVCLLRLRKARAARNVLGRTLDTIEDFYDEPVDPDLYEALQINFATSQFMTGQITEGEASLDEIGLERNATVILLRELAAGCRERHTWWRRLLRGIGFKHVGAVHLEFQPGILPTVRT